MKRVVLTALIALFLVGCGAAAHFLWSQGIEVDALALDATRFKVCRHHTRFGIGNVETWWEWNSVTNLWMGPDTEPRCVSQQTRV